MVVDRNAEAELAFDAAGKDVDMMRTVANEFPDTTWGKLAVGKVEAAKAKDDSRLYWQRCNCRSWR